MSIFESLESLNVSEECFKHIVSLIEGDIIDFAQKRKEKVLDKNAHKMSDLIQSGATRAVRILPNGQPMGEPYVVNQLKQISKEISEVTGKIRGK